MYPQNITVRLKFSVCDIYAICGAIAVIASTTYMTTMSHSLTHSDMLDSDRSS